MPLNTRTSSLSLSRAMKRRREESTIDAEKRRDFSNSISWLFLSSSFVPIISTKEREWKDRRYWKWISAGITFHSLSREILSSFFPLRTQERGKKGTRKKNPRDTSLKETWQPADNFRSTAALSSFKEGVIAKDRLMVDGSRPPFLSQKEKKEKRERTRRSIMSLGDYHQLGRLDHRCVSLLLVLTSMKAGGKKIMKMRTDTRSYRKETDGVCRGFSSSIFFERERNSSFIKKRKEETPRSSSRKEHLSRPTRMPKKGI